MQQSLKDHYDGKPVKIKFTDGRIVTGHISGRLSPFAHVTWEDTETMHMGISVAWETVISCVNNGRPVLI